MHDSVTDGTHKILEPDNTLEFHSYLNNPQEDHNIPDQLKPGSLVKESGKFTLSILGSGQKSIATSFFKHVEPEGGKFGNFAFEAGKNGAPIISHAPAAGARGGAGGRREGRGRGGSPGGRPPRGARAPLACGAAPAALAAGPPACPTAPPPMPPSGSRR